MTIQDVLFGVFTNGKGENSEKSKTELEWIGDLRDLENSIVSIPNYIRGLRNEGESLEECARRLVN